MPAQYATRASKKPSPYLHATTAASGVPLSSRIATACAASVELAKR